jgi:hypothetical protein
MRLLAAWLLASLAVGPAAAQTRPRPPARPVVEKGFIGVNAGLQEASASATYRTGFVVNVEEGTIDVRSGGRTALLIDAQAGIRLRGRFGLALAVSRGSRSGAASVSAEIPHPFFDDRHRHVEGDAGGIGLSETAGHLELYYDIRPRGAWQVRLLAGPSYFRTEQDLVTGVQAVETFPYDTAEFSRATTTRASGSALGFNAGVDISRMVTRRAGAGVLVRFARGRLDLNAPGSRPVSTDAGGLQAAAGVRFLF